MTDLQQQIQNIRGLKTAWVEAGVRHAPLVFFFHGYPDTPEVWKHQIAHLEKTFRIIAPYARGMGESEPPRDAGGRASRFSTTSLLLDFLEILTLVQDSPTQPVFVVGHDLGCIHAWNFAQQLGRRCRGMVLINGLNIKQMIKRFKNPAQLAKSWYMFVMQMPGVADGVLRVASRPFWRRIFQTAELPIHEQPDQSTLRQSAINGIQFYRSFFREAYQAYSQTDYYMETPTLVLWGQHDAFLVPPKKAEFERDLKNVSIRILPGNHWLQKQCAEQVNRHLYDFFMRQAEHYYTLPAKPGEDVSWT